MNAPGADIPTWKKVLTTPRHKSILHSRPDPLRQ
jgi:hypothetical protein